MKIDIYKDESSVAHNVESDSMRIDTSKQAKLFHMLSSTLYSNKVAAVIRELASNGYDSHKAAGKLDTTRLPFLHAGTARYGSFGLSV